MGINALRQVPGVPNVYFDEAAFLQSMGMEVEEEASEELKTDVIRSDGTVVKAGAARVIEFPTQDAEETATDEAEEHKNDEAEVAETKVTVVAEQPQPVGAEQPKAVEVERVETADVAQPKTVEGEQPKPAAAAESSVEKPTTEALEGAKKEKAYSKIGKLAAKLTNFGGRKVARGQVERTKALLNSDRAGQDVTTGRSADVAFARSTQLKNQEGREVSTPETDAQLFVDNWIQKKNREIREKQKELTEAQKQYTGFYEQAKKQEEAHELQQDLVDETKKYAQQVHDLQREIEMLESALKRPEGKYSAVEWADSIAAQLLKTSWLPLYRETLEKWDQDNHTDTLEKFESQNDQNKFVELGKFLVNGKDYYERLGIQNSAAYYRDGLDLAEQLAFRKAPEVLQELFATNDFVPVAANGE